MAWKSHTFSIATPSLVSDREFKGLSIELYFSSVQTNVSGIVDSVLGLRKLCVDS